MRSHKLGTKDCFIAAEALQAMPRVKTDHPQRFNLHKPWVLLRILQLASVGCARRDMRIYIVARQPRPGTAPLAIKSKSIIQDHACSRSTLTPED